VILIGCHKRRLAKKTTSLIKKETNKRRTSNIERPTSNKVFCQLKKTAYACFAEVATKPYSETTLRIFSTGGGFCDPLVIKSIKRSVINIRRSMLDVRCSMFKLCTASARRIFTQDMGYKIRFLAPEEPQAA
jgi:hypothetical protein